MQQTFCRQQHRRRRLQLNWIMRARRDGGRVASANAKNEFTSDLWICHLVSVCVCGAYRVSVAKAEVEVHCATSHGRLGKQEVKEVVEDAVNQRISFAFSLALFLSFSHACFQFSGCPSAVKAVIAFFVTLWKFFHRFCMFISLFSITSRQLRKINVNEELEKWTQLKSSINNATE